MAEYIEREASLLEIEEWADTFCECDYVFPHIMESIKKLPAADVRPVVRGKWINLDSDSERYDDIKCSNCSKKFTVDSKRWCDIGFIVSDLHYCPNCGAWMEES